MTPPVSTNVTPDLVSDPQPVGHPPAHPPALQWRDYVTLTKPRITALCLIMTLGGMGLAPHDGLRADLVFWTLLGTFFSVGAANALNMYWEREGDKLMERTRRRPLASGRMKPWQALTFGLGLGALSVVVLWMAVNPLTAFLGTFALASYVLVYTPLKRRSPLALVVGAVPGAMPPLMGWTAVTGQVNTSGLVLFGILLAWQIPHFIAISICHREDYARAGIATVPSKHGDGIAKLQSLAYALLLIPISLMFVPLGVAGPVYFALAFALGVWFTWHAAKGFRADADKPWARKFFFASLIYLPALTLAMVADMTLGRYFG